MSVGFSSTRIVNNTMVYLLGISHRFQVRTFKSPLEGGSLTYDPSLADRFEKHLEFLIEAISPLAICEEDSETCILSVVEIDDRAYSVVSDVCARRMRHVFCEPELSEREKLYAAKGTTVSEDEKNGWAIRENEWLRRISPMLPHGRLLFICGANHIDTFKCKLENNGVIVEIICPDLEEEWNSATLKM